MSFIVKINSLFRGAVQFIGRNAKYAQDDLAVSVRAPSLGAIYLLFGPLGHARNCRGPRERRGRIVNHTQIEEVKMHEPERDFLCVVRDAFRVFARRSAIVLGTAWAFAFAILVIVVWGATGPKFHYSDTWQLVINTGTTIVTFLMVFVIQNTQNRDARAIHLKLDELIRGLKGARNRLVDLENWTEEELDQMEREFRRIRERARERQVHHHHAQTHPAQIPPETVNWTARRHRMSLASLAVAAIAGCIIGTATFSIDDDLGYFVGSVAAPVLWLVATSFLWRETADERADRIRSTSKNAVVCPV